MRTSTLGQAMRVVAQAWGFWLVSEAGFALASYLGVAVPGNLLGMVALFVLLATGIVKLEWVNAGATFLLRHLAFFFIPIAVGLMTMGVFIRSHGLLILAVLVVSAAAGILVSGGVVQALVRRGTAHPAKPKAAQRVAP